MDLFDTLVCIVLSPEDWSCVSSSLVVKNLNTNYSVTEYTMKRKLLLTGVLLENGRGKLICDQKVQDSMVLQRAVSVQSADKILAHINA